MLFCSLLVIEHVDDGVFLFFGGVFLHESSATLGTSVAHCMIFIITNRHILILNTVDKSKCSCNR